MLMDTPRASPQELPTHDNLVSPHACARPGNQLLNRRRRQIRAMQWLVRDARPNDSLFFHYSGHGGQTEDLDGDEVSAGFRLRAVDATGADSKGVVATQDDGFDEVGLSLQDSYIFSLTCNRSRPRRSILWISSRRVKSVRPPFHFPSRQGSFADSQPLLVDDLMHDIMVRSLPQGCRLTAIFDSVRPVVALSWKRRPLTRTLLSSATRGQLSTSLTSIAPKGSSRSRSQSCFFHPLRRWSLIPVMPSQPSRRRRPGSSRCRKGLHAW